MAERKALTLGVLVQLQLPLPKFFLTFYKNYSNMVITMKGNKEHIATIDGNKLLAKRRVMLQNKTVPHKNKKKYAEKYKCRKKVKL